MNGSDKSLYWRRGKNGSAQIKEFILEKRKEWFSSDKLVYIGEGERIGFAQM